MNIHNAIRALTVAPVLAAAILGAPANFAHAEQKSPQQACAERHGIWVFDRCADKTCRHNGETYYAGEFIRVLDAWHNSTYWNCDGFTGQWVQVRTTTPSGPAAPAGSGTVAPAGTTNTTGPVGPRPMTNAR